VNGRVKTISSILDKAQKKKIPLDEVVDRLEDIAGIRIICQFVEDIERVVEIIHNRTDMIVKSEKDYITNTKKSGYRSYHIIIYYDVQTMKGSKRITAEIQIRTLAMNFWSTIEHSLQYKYKGSIPEHIREKLTNASDAILLLDNEMSSVRSEIMDAQNSFQIQANLVSDILNNIQNLYNLANKREIVRIQDEFYRIYQQNDLEQLERFHKQLDIIAEGYRAQSITHSYEENT
jgi:putative GTP pyrophosphokinase